MSTAYFQQLLTQYNTLLNFESHRPKTDACIQIESELWQKYGCKKAVLIIDMSGFSKLTEQYGVVHYLSMIQRMETIVSTKIAIGDHGGIIVKFFADNCLIVFPDTLSAIQFSILLNDVFDIGNIVTPDELDIYISCGIDFGDILMVGGKDCFGNAVNRASKLGEDIAKAGQILVTQEAMSCIPESEDIKTVSKQTITISKVELVYHDIDHSKKAR